MSLTPAYIPTHGTLADRVVEWFRANPDEELNLPDVAQKFDVPQTSVSPLLSGACVDGRLHRCFNRQGYVYRLGGTSPQARQQPAPPAPPGATSDLMFSISPDRCIAVSFFVPGLIDPRRVLAAMLETAATTIGKQP